jgi:hypothetical protein
MPSADSVSSGKICHSSESRLKSEVDPWRLRVSIGSARMQGGSVSSYSSRWAHRRARPTTEDALAVIGKEDRVDQLRLAARKLGHEGDDELVLGQTVDRDVDAARRIGLQHLALGQPVPQLHDRRRERVTPGSVLFEARG